MTLAVRDVPLAAYRQAAGLPGIADPEGRVVAVRFEKVLVSTPLFFPVTLDLHAFRDAYQVPGLYLEEAYDAIFDPAFAAGLAPRRDVLAAAAPGDAELFVLGGSSNHFHWLLDFLPRLAAIRHGPAPDALIVPAGLDPRQQEALAVASAALAMPMPPQRAVPDGVVGLRRATMPVAVSRPVAIAFWRRVLEASGIVQRPRRRLFVRRGSVARRRLLDEAEVAGRFAEAGFEPVDPGALDFAAQMRLFAEAAVVVGAHGAALANAAFMPAGATLVEIAAQDAASPFGALAAAAGLRYGALRAEVAGATAADRLHADLRLPPGAVAALLAQL
ncbi:hypothetical protein STAQ_31330 [Allostella sp. ATCC 35155]|nr:hypothetical protein STAQ_31330 [Stella sp. ATCC 35155]